MRWIAAFAFLVVQPRQEAPPKTFKGLEIELSVNSQTLRVMDVLPCRIEIRNASRVPFITSPSLPLQAYGLSFLILRGDVAAPGRGQSLPSPHVLPPCHGCCRPSKLPGPDSPLYKKEKAGFSMEPGTGIQVARLVSLMAGPQESRDVQGLPLPGTWWIQARLSLVDWGDYYSNAIKLDVELPGNMPRAAVQIFSRTDWHNRAIRCLLGKESPVFAYADPADLKPFVDYLGSGVQASQNPLLSLVLGHALKTGRRLVEDEEVTDPKSKRKVPRKAGFIVKDPEAALAYFQAAADGLRESHLRAEAQFMLAQCLVDVGRRKEAVGVLQNCSPEGADHPVKYGILRMKRELSVN